MSDRKLFYEDASLDRVETEIVESGVVDGRPFVRLAETVFYPEGGGQPCDRGTIAGIPVVEVRARGSEVLHVLERPLPGGRVLALIDAQRRFDLRQQHTAQHLLSAILHDRHRMPTTSFHLGDEYTAIEVSGPVPDRARLAGFEAEANAEIRADREVRTREVEPGELAALGVRTRGLPEGHAGRVRLVEIAGIDLNTCGGTHVDRLAELQLLYILDAAPARGVTRIRFLAGGRTLRELQRLAVSESAIKERLGTGPEAFAAALDGWRADAKNAERRIRALETEVARSRAAEIATGAGQCLCARLEGMGPEMLSRIAAAALERRPEAVVVLVGDVEDSGEACLFVQSGSAGPPDVSEIGQRASEALGARGGGKGRRYQGRGGRFSDRVFASFRVD